MNILKNNLRLNLLYLLVGVGAFLIFTGYSNKTESEVIEYLSINVEYNPNFQRITIRDKTEVIEKIAIVSPKCRKGIKKRFKKSDFRIIEKKIAACFDSSTLIELLEKYGTAGWELNSQSLGVNIDDNDEVGLFEVDDDVRIGQYFLSRKTKK